MSRIDFSQVMTAQALAEADARQQAAAEAQALLAGTDWYLVRKVETGAAVPRTVLEARKAARALLSN